MKRLIAVFLFTFTLQAQADSNVTCINQDCLNDGWVDFDTITQITDLVVCNVGGCEFRGWRSFPFSGPVTDVVCEGRGCFIDGYNEFNAIIPSEDPLRILQCRPINNSDKRDCLIRGWNTIEHDGFGDLIKSKTKCTAKDCRVIGWEAKNETDSVTTCKPGGCFVEGWITEIQ